MRLVFGLVLILGLGLAGFAVFMAQGYIRHYQTALAAERQARAAQVPLTEIFVAARPLRYGEVLAPEDARLVRFPAESLPEGVFSEAAALFPENAPGPRIVLRAIETNEPLLAVKLTQPGGDAGVSTMLARGMRAFAIRVDVTSGVSGFLSPGDRVDVFWSGEVNNEGVTKLIEAGLRIIAVDQTADQDLVDPTIARTVTVEAAPEQVAALAQAQSSGKLSLALVGIADDTVAARVQIDQRQLLGIVDAPPPAPVEVVEERICTIKTRRGSEIVETPIPCTN